MKKQIGLILIILMLAGRAGAQIVPRGLLPTGDNTVALQTAFSTPAGGGCNYVSMPPGTWPFSGTLTIDTNCMGYESNGATLRYTGGGAALIANNSALGGGPYRVNRHPWTNLNLSGPGQQTPATGLLVETSNWGVDGLNIQGFGTGIKFGNYGYTDWFRNAVLIGNNTNIWCPAGLIDAGENISFDGGTSSNAAVGVHNAICEINFDNFSFDYLSTTSLYNTGVMRLSHVHVEHSPIAVQGAVGENGYSHLTAEDSDWINDGPATSNTMLTINGGYAQLSRIHIASLATGPVVTGSATNQALCEEITEGSGPVDNIVGQLKPCP